MTIQLTPITSSDAINHYKYERALSSMASPEATIELFISPISKIASVRRNNHTTLIMHELLAPISQLLLIEAIIKQHYYD